MDQEPTQREMRKLLTRLPDAPVASNFTARVMQAIDLEEARAHRRGWNLIWSWRIFLPRVAVAAVAISIAGLTLQHHRLAGERSELAKNVAFVAQTPMPSVEALKDFDAIKSMGHPARADDELLALLQ
jgi:negative regulator of sigma E activity